MEPVTLSAFATFFGLETAKYLYKKYALDKLLISQDSLEEELRKVVIETTSEYKNKYPISKIGKLYPFYDSEVLMEELLKFRIMHEDDYDIKNLYNAFETEINVIPPSTKDIDLFFDLFIRKINESETLRKVEIKQTFTNEIFLISRKIDAIQHRIENLLLNFGADLELQWKSRIDTYIDTLKKFKPKTALGLLQSLESSFSESTKQPTSEFLAMLEYQKGLCYSLMGIKDETHKAFINAYFKNKTNKVFKEQAAISYLKINEPESALSLCEELLQSDVFNSKAWAVKILLSDEGNFIDNFKKVPSLVKSDITFLRTIYHYLAYNTLNQKLIKDLSDDSLLPEIESYKEIPITINSYSEVVFWINIGINQYLRNYKLVFTHKYTEGKSVLEIVNRILSNFIATLDGSEIEKDYFLQSVYHYVNYVLTDDGKQVIEMYKAFLKTNKNSDFYTIICANALQLEGYDVESLECLGTLTEANEAASFLKCFINYKIYDLDNYVISAREYLEQLQAINYGNVNNYFDIVVTLKATGNLYHFTVDEFIGNKTFEDEKLKEIIQCIVTLFIEGKTKALQNELAGYAETSDDLNMLSVIANSFYQIEEYELAITNFKKFINPEEVGRDLLNYILSLHKSKKHNEELLSLLERWRKNYPFYEELLIIEADKRRQLFEWEKCIEICDYYLSTYPEGESFLVLKLISLNELDVEANLSPINALSAKLENFEFNHTPHAKTVAEILMKLKFYKIGLEIFYKYAEDKENGQIRLGYIMSYAKYGNDEDFNSLVKELDEVEEGCFVKYELDRNVHFIELNKKNLENPLNSKFLGHKKHDVIPIQRPIIGTIDNIKIVRIMNKYLSLHDEILEEVNSNPYSNTPMQSVELEGTDFESINKKFISMYGAQGTIAKNETENLLKKYYENKISFSEVIMSLFQGNYLGGYYNLAHASQGINTFPLVAFKGLSIKGKEFVLDYTSLIIFHQISKEHSIEYPHKFILSKFIADQIRRQLNDYKDRKTEEMSLSITMDGVIPNIVSEQTHRNNYTFVKNLLEWIDNNCIIELSPKILDFKTDSCESIPLLEYAMNNFLLREDNNRILITDDTIYLQPMTNALETICSAELYFKYTFGHNHPGFIEFLKNKYRGISISEAQLIIEFEKKIKSQVNFYSNCIENFSPKLNPENAFPAIKLIKHIALHQLINEEQERQEITLIFVSLMKDVPDKNIWNYLGYLIREECKLLGHKLDFILLCLRDAINIIIMS